MEQPQLLLPEGDANYSAIADYKDHRGYEAAEATIGKTDPEEVVSVVKESGLRGRGVGLWSCLKPLHFHPYGWTGRGAGPSRARSSRARALCYGYCVSL